MKTGIFAVLTLTALGAGAARAEKGGEPWPREIVVTGDADVKVVPDEVILTIAVETIDKDLLTAKQQNDDRVKKVLAVTQQFKIDPKNVQTDQITIEPRYKNYNQDNQSFIGFNVRKSVVICVKDMKSFEPILLALIKAGTNRVDGVRFQTTELRKHRDHARLQAVKAAREKAQAMAAELGQKIGRAHSIVENGPPQVVQRSYNALVNEGGDASGEGGFAPGQISVTASVTIHFDLAD
jgi:uncharacterized protein YggE